ncbi:MAG TPA: DUF4293 domain-containing protein [Paludibacter sp.]|nr:MAG: hypothetical protein BWY08_02311 [Bacteroidetes bacterium ADurb.Bin174]HQB27976.1 DUF4293 domain-containing protein [Paludibacter sp.]
MLQRIQTIYLLLTVILISLMFFLPIAGLQNVQDGIIYELNYKGLFELNVSGNTFVANVWMLTALMVMIPSLALITIFLFKKRFLQIRLIIFNIVLMAGYYGMLFIYLWQYGKSLSAKLFVEIPSAFPLVCIILNILAIRAIARDEALIRSLNRLR